MVKSRAIRFGACALLFLGGVAACDLPRSPEDPLPIHDPITADPADVDPESPPYQLGVNFTSHGKRLNGLWLGAAGPGPHPTVVLLHGFPGNEKNLDLAQALRRAGINVLFFHYRGAWGSAGIFSFGNALEDVATVVERVRTHTWVEPCDSECRSRVDPERIALVGHSMGGGLALLAAARDPSIDCTVAIDYWNMGHVGAEVKAQLSEAGELPEDLYASAVELTAEGGPLQNGGNPEALWMELVEHGDDLNPVTYAEALAGQKLFLISIANNDQHPRLVEAVRSGGRDGLFEEVWSTDHSFQDKRIALSRAVSDWLRDSCGF